MDKDLEQLITACAIASFNITSAIHDYANGESNIVDLREYINKEITNIDEIEKRLFPNG